MILFNLMLTLLSPFSRAEELSPSLPVLIRDKRFRPVLVERPMRDLEDRSSFSGRHFKLVLGKAEAPIRLDEKDPELRLRAATVYHHLTEARRYWQDSLRADSLLPEKALTIRLEMENRFSDFFHFERDGVNPESNNALSIPGGFPRPGSMVQPWGPEIWFRPMKVIDVRDLPESGLGAGENPITFALSQINGSVRSAVTARLLQATLLKLFYPNLNAQPIGETVLRQAGTLAVTSLLLEVAKRSDRLFMEKTFYLDTAMIPEIVRHEFAHIALSGRLPLTHSTPVIEGFADYFAADQGDHPKLADRIRRYSNSIGKNGKNRRLYDPVLERSLYANSDFVLSVLWGIRERLGSRANAVILGATEAIDTGRSGIRQGLIRALLRSCEKNCESPVRDGLRLRSYFEERGF